MSAVIKVEGLRAATGAQVIPFNNEENQVAQIPELTHWFDPSYPLVSTPPLSFQDQISDKSWTAGTSDATLNATGMNSTPAVILGGDANQGVRATLPMTTSYSVLMAFEQSASATETLFANTDSSGGDDILIRTVTSGRFSISHKDGGISEIVGSSAYGYNTPVLAGFTFNGTTNAMSVWVNNKTTAIATETLDAAPTGDREIIIGGKDNTFAPFTGKHGHFLWFNADMGASANLSNWQKAFDHLAGIYGVSV